MDISVVIVPSTTSAGTASASSVSSAASAGAGKSQTLNAAAGKSQDASKGTESFTQVLGGQMAQENVNEPTDAAMTLAGLMQMLQSLTMPLQNVLQNQEETKGTDDQGLPEMLLKAMNSNDEIADKLLQDPNLNQWFQQAQAILSALSGTETAPVLASNSLVTAVNSKNLKAQNTLLTLSSMLKEQPDNVILQHLTKELQNAIQPLLPQLTQGLNQTSANLNLVEKGVGFDAIKENVLTAGLVEQNESTKNSKAMASNKHRTISHSSKLEAAQSEVVVVQQVKSQLEFLAAKNAVNTPLFATAVDPKGEIELVPEVNPDTTANDSPTMQLADMLKTPLQTETVVKAVPQTMNAANFAQEMTEHVLKNMKITLADGISEAKLSLYPKNLGHVEVKITMHEGQLVAQFATDTLAGKQMLEGQLSQLRQSLQSQGLQVDKLEVTQNSNMQSGMFQDQRHQQTTNQNTRQNKNKANANYELDNVEFVQELSSAVQAKNSVNGNSFDVTA